MLFLRLFYQLNLAPKSRGSTKCLLDCLQIFTTLAMSNLSLYSIPAPCRYCSSTLKLSRFRRRGPIFARRTSK